MGVIKRLRGTPRQRVVVLGFDGVPFSLLRDHPDRFEHIDAVFEAGNGVSIESTIPPESSASWPSLTSGLNPGETGVYGLIDRELESYRTYVTGGNDVLRNQDLEGARRNLAAAGLRLALAQRHHGGEGAIQARHHVGERHVGQARR
ncbi:MAG: alkaline phosphatase family protein, partial [Halobacteriota archaeon]